MKEELLSPNQVAEMLGLHVRTVRNYVREGRLPATRIGKQYRIARSDLEAFAGTAAAGRAADVRRQRRVEVSSVVRIDVVDPAAASRISNGLVATAGARPQDGPRGLQVECLYDESSGRLTVVVSGDLDATAYLLKLIDLYLEPTP